MDNRDKSRNIFSKNRGKISAVCGLLALIILVLYKSISADASEEYRYTIEQIFKFGFFPLLLVFLIAFPFYRQIFACFSPWLTRIPTSKVFLAIFGICGLIFILIPIFSPYAFILSWEANCILSLCWILGSFLLFVCMVGLAIRLNNFFSSILSMAATLLLVFCIAEIWFLMTTQTADGVTGDDRHSKYALADQGYVGSICIDTPIGFVPRKPPHPSSAVVHRELYYGKPKFDVLYTIDDDNRRVMPQPGKDFKADLLLFGCSFTFGFGLEDEQTWAWQLAKLLGPEWKVVNYGFSAFGAQQMFTWLEEGLVAEPTAPLRQALFMGIWDHIQRFTGLFSFNSPWYVLEDGKLLRKGVTNDSPYAHIAYLHMRMNGSQTAREAAKFMAGIILKYKQNEFQKIYIELIVRSAEFLKKKYNTQLTVLMWEYADLGPELEKYGIPVLHVSDFLPEMKTKGPGQYQLLENVDIHPNAQAAKLIATGLAKYYQKIYSNSLDKE